jgi:hypothetical protein
MSAVVQCSHKIRGAASAKTLMQSNCGRIPLEHHETVLMEKSCGVRAGCVALTLALSSRMRRCESNDC